MCSHMHEREKEEEGRWVKIFLPSLRIIILKYSQVIACMNSSLIGGLNSFFRYFLAILFLSNDIILLSFLTTCETIKFELAAVSQMPVTSRAPRSTDTAILRET